MKKKAKHAKYKTKLKRRLLKGKLDVLELPVGMTVDEAMSMYRKSKDIDYVEPNYVWQLTEKLPNDTLFSSHLWAMKNTGQIGICTNPPEVFTATEEECTALPGASWTTASTAGADIDAPTAWEVTTGDNSLVVAVIDTGVDFTHEDIVSNMWTNPYESIGDANTDGCPGICNVDDDGDGLIDEDSLGNSRYLEGGTQNPDWLGDIAYDDDENGFEDDVYGYSPITGNSSPPMDRDGHGTHCAGTVSGKGDNGVGVAGVSWNTQIMACQMFDGLYGTTDAGVMCLDYVAAMAERGVNIVTTSNSWGQYPYSQALYDAIKNHLDLGLLVTTASGNAGTNMDTNGNFFYPGAYDLPNIINVGGTSFQDSIYGNYGQYSVDVNAPGVEIVSLRASGSNMYGDQNHFAPYGDSSAKYYRASGTSMAAPHVAGLAALIKAEEPYRTWSEIKNLILTGADPLPALDGLTVSGRRINASGSLNCTDSPLSAPLKAPDSGTINQGETYVFSYLSINCEAPAGSVSVEFSTGETLDLTDNGVSPDQAAGDGVFSASWTATVTAPTYNFNVSQGIFFTGVVSTTTEGAPVAQGMVSISEIQSEDIVINLMSSIPGQLDISPQSITIPAGSLSAVFSYTAVDDILLDGSQNAVITASANIMGTPATYSKTVVVHDNESPALSLALPNSISEHDGPLAGPGTLSVSSPVDGDVFVSLRSSSPQKIMVPDTVLIASGSTSASFDITIGNSLLLDGSGTVEISAEVSGWQPATETIVYTEDNNIYLTLPESAGELDGVLTQTGIVAINGFAPQNIVFTLSAAPSGEINIPASVTIRAGQMSTTFELEILHDGVIDGTKVITIEASAPELNSGQATITVLDKDPGEISLHSDVIRVAEDAGEALLTVERFPSSDGVITVDYATSPGTALASEDYTSVSGTLEFAAGEFSKTVSIPLINDGIMEHPETLNFILSNPGGGAILGSVSMAELEIIDSEPRDYSTEYFEGENDTFDLENKSITLSPQEIIAGYWEYAVCSVTEAAHFPTDPTGGTEIEFMYNGFGGELTEESIPVLLQNSAMIPFHGTDYDTIYINFNGHMHFNENSDVYWADLTQHFLGKRISPLLMQSWLKDTSSVTYKQLEDRLVVTYENILSYSWEYPPDAVPYIMDSSNNYQVEMFFDGTVRITWLNIDAKDFATYNKNIVVGISNGTTSQCGPMECPVPDSYVERDLSTIVAGDSDGDSVSDFCDNCVDIINPDQRDLNNDEIGDVCAPYSELGSNLTELFDSGSGESFDLAYRTVTFTPDGSQDFYSVCSASASTLPSDTTGGTTLNFQTDPYKSDDSIAIDLADNKSIPFYGSTYSRIYVNPNGHLHFADDPSDYDLAVPTLEGHFKMKRISALLSTANPAAATVSWKQFDDRLSVTYDNFATHNDGGTGTFQAELFFDGTIQLTWLDVNKQSFSMWNSTIVVGLSDGGIDPASGLPLSFSEEDLDMMQTCSGQ